MYWNSVLKEILDKTDKKRVVSVTNVTKIKSTEETGKPKPYPNQKTAKNYFLGDKYGKTYFTKREAECMLLLIKGRTISKVAKELNLSPRTVEYYLKNMKAKVGCRTKFELIEVVLESDFMKTIDF